MWDGLLTDLTFTFFGNKGDKYANSIADPRVLFNSGIEKNYSDKLCVPPLYCDVYTLIIETFKYHWVPRM